MSWRFRKTFKLLPGVKLNLTRHGLSATLGAAPFSLNVGPRGIYRNVSVPGTGLWSRERLDIPSQGQPSEQPPPFDHETIPPPHPSAPIAPLAPSPSGVTGIRSASTEFLNSKSMDELRKLLKEAYEERGALTQEISRGEQEARIAAARYQSWERGLLFKRAFKKSFAIRKDAHDTAQAKLEELREQLRLTAVATQIDIDREQAESYYRMRDDFAALSECQRIWDTLERRAVNRVVERSAANEAITREPVSFSLNCCDLIQWEQNVPHLPNCAGGDMYVYPGFVLYRASRQAFALIDSREVTLTFRPVRFIEEQTIPSDTQTVGQAWAKSNKDGSADRRFRGNYQIPIALYGALLFTSRSGLQEEYQCSNPALAERFVHAWNAFRASLTSTDPRCDVGQRASAEGAPSGKEHAAEILAQMKLGITYYSGDGEPKDYAKAARLLRAVAEMEDAQIRNMFPESPEALSLPKSAQTILASIYFVGGEGVPKDDAEAARWYRMAAERGDADAQRNLAQLFKDGTGVAQDYSRAAYWCRRSAEQGHSVGQAMLGEMYYVGQGVSQDYREALRWFTTAAEQDQVQAQTKLGLMLAAGGDIDDPKPEQEVPQDYISAYMWLDLAAGAGEARAQEGRDLLAAKMTGTQLAKGQRLAREHLQLRRRAGLK
jgi:TPR repeat protein